jgi:hypothetical protein
LHQIGPPETARANEGGFDEVLSRLLAGAESRERVP